MMTEQRDMLDRRIQKLEKKAERIQNAQDTDTQAESARESLARLQSKMSSIEDTASELGFYVAVLEDVFDGTRPTAVDSALLAAKRAVDIDDETLLTDAENRRLSDHINDISEAEDDLRRVRDSVTKTIEREHQNSWEDDLDSASQLNQIIGGKHSEFESLINSIRSFLNQDVWKSSNSPTVLSQRWAELQRKWEENSGKHGWEPFQEEHGLSNKTIEEIKQFTSQDTVHLSDFSISSLEEIKGVEELESALEVSLHS